MENEWVYDLESKIYSIVKTKANAMEVSEGVSLIQKFPTLKWTTTDSSSSSANFPCVYLHELGGTEVGQDLVNKTINGVMENIEVTVYTATTQADARLIMACVIEVLKSLRFSVSPMPEFENLSTTYRCICRARRMVGSGDTF